MKVQIVKRGEHFFVRRKGLFGIHRYLARHLLWWSVEIYPNEKYHGFTSLEKAKADLDRYVENERANKLFLEKDKLQRRRRRKLKMIVIEEIVIDV